MHMKKRTWKSRITKACKTAGTYQPFFDHVIDSLAGIMEIRDSAREKYEENGSEPVTEHTNKNGAQNIIKNPALAVIVECDSLALAYWKELGLTSRAYKAVTDGKMQKTEEPKRLDSIRSKLKVAK